MLFFRLGLCWIRTMFIINHFIWCVFIYLWVVNQWVLFQINRFAYKFFLWNIPVNYLVWLVFMHTKLNNSIFLGRIFMNSDLRLAILYIERSKGLKHERRVRSCGVNRWLDVSVDVQFLRNTEYRLKEK